MRLWTLMETVWLVRIQCRHHITVNSNLALIDVFLVCDEGNGGKSYQVWLNKKSQGFVQATRGALPSGTQSVSFADIGTFNLCFLICHISKSYSLDRDGTMDMVFTTCTRVSSNGVGTDCYVNIAYNQQLGLCSSTTDSGIKNGARVCRPPNDLCTADDNFQFNLQDGPDNEVNILLLHICQIKKLTTCQGFRPLPHFIPLPRPLLAPCGGYLV